MGKNSKANRSKNDDASFSELDLSNKMDKLLSKFNTFDTKLNTESASAKKRHEQLNSELKKLSRKITEVEKRVEHVESSNDFMNEEVKELRNTVNSLQQAAYRDELIIRGVPDKESSEEELLTVVQLIVRAVNCVPEPTICVVKRLGKKTNDDRNNRPILLQLSHATEKEKLLTMKKKMKNLTCAQITLDGSTTLGSENQVIYFDERLTKTTSDLYRNARILRKQQKLKYVWIRNGQLYVRKRDNDPTIRVDSQEQLDKWTRKRKHNSTPKKAKLDEEMELDDEDDEDSSSAESVVSQVSKRTRHGKKNDQ